MRRTGTWLGLIAAVLVAGSASAIPSITLDGDWSDWFSYGGTIYNDWDEAAATSSILDSAIRTFVDPDEGVAGEAQGGQPFDIEQVFYFYDDDDANALSGGTLYIGIVTGVDPDGAHPIADPLDIYYAGDVFLDLGADADFDLAVAVGTETTPENDGGARFGRTFVNSPGWSTIGVVVSDNDYNDPYRVDDGAGGFLEYGVDTALTSGVAWGVDAGAGTTRNFLEICVELDGAFEEQIDNGLGDGGLGLHWTMGCGNDAVDFSDDVPLAPVPEPTTMVLLGMGVVGMALRARRRPMC